MAGTWSAGSNLTYSTYAPYAGGDPASAFAAGGSGTANKTCKEWNGSSWSNGGSLLNVRTRCSGGDCGNASNAIVSGGHTGSSTYNTSMYYNGTSWTGYGTMAAARWSHFCAGNGSDAYLTSGANKSSVKIKTSEAWNGSTWASSSDYTIEHIASAGGGNSTNCIVAAGLNTSTYQATCQAWNGSSWVGKASLNMARHECGGGGSSVCAVIFGGRDSAITASTEEYDGTSWAAGGNLNTARRLVSGGASISGSNGSGISIAGYTTTTVATMETYAWTWSEPSEIIRQLASNRQSSGDRLERFNPVLLWTPPTVLTTPTYDGSGQAVHPTVVYIAAGFAGYTYWMGMTPYPSGNDDYENPSLLASNDGLTWVVPDGITNPLAAKPSGTNAHNSDCAFWWDSGASTLYLYYVQKADDGTHTVYRFPITQGPLTVGTKVACTISYTTGIYAPTVWKNGTNDWVMWFVDNDVNVRRYTSTDGLTWTLEAVVGQYDQDGKPVKATINPWHTCVRKFGDRFLFLCCAYPYGGNNAQTDLYWGIADDQDDSITWDTTPILTEFSGWGSRQVYLSCIEQIADGSWRIYISAATSTPTWRIGYAAISLQ